MVAMIFNRSFDKPRLGASEARPKVFPLTGIVRGLEIGSGRRSREATDSGSCAQGRSSEPLTHHNVGLLHQFSRAVVNPNLGCAA
jgi:hypothetical protein